MTSLLYLEIKEENKRTKLYSTLNHKKYGQLTYRMWIIIT